MGSSRSGLARIPLAAAGKTSDRGVCRVVDQPCAGREEESAYECLADHDGTGPIGCHDLPG